MDHEPPQKVGDTVPYKSGWPEADGLAVILPSENRLLCPARLRPFVQYDMDVWKETTRFGNKALSKSVHSTEPADSSLRS